MASGANARHRGFDAAGPAVDPRLATATGATDGAGLGGELRGGGSVEDVEAVVVAPVAGQGAVERTAGEAEPARERARRRLAA